MLTMIRLATVALVVAKVAFCVYTLNLLITFDWDSPGIPWRPIMFVSLCLVLLLPNR
jgi:hypothetical protein